MSKIVGQRITQARKAKGLSLNRAASIIGVSRTGLTDWEKGRRVTPKNRSKLIKGLGMKLEDFNEFPGGASLIDPDEPRLFVPDLPWSELKFYNAGKLNMTGLRRLKQTEAASLDHSPDSIALRVQDDSMEPVFKSGEKFIIDPHLPPQDGNYVVARLASGEHLLRQYRAHDDGAFDLVAKKAGVYKTLTASTKAPVTLLGVVVEHHKDLRNSRPVKLAS